MLSEDEIKQITGYVDAHIRSLQSMKIDEEKEYVTNDDVIHKLKRIDKYTWEYICPCCNGKRLAIGDSSSIDMSLNEKMHL